MQLQPQENFTIVRLLGDPADVGTHYVKATIRQAKTDKILATLILTDKGSRRFTKDWQAPADVAGTGLWIDVTTTVYDDALMMTPGTDSNGNLYYEESDVYLVKSSVSSMGGGSIEVDYGKISKIMALALKAEFDGWKFPGVDFSSVLNAISDARHGQTVNAPSFDFKPLLEAVAGSERAIIASLKEHGLTIAKNAGKISDLSVRTAEEFKIALALCETHGLDSSESMLEFGNKLENWLASITTLKSPALDTREYVAIPAITSRERRASVARKMLGRPKK